MESFIRQAPSTHSSLIYPFSGNSIVSRCGHGPTSHPEVMCLACYPNTKPRAQNSLIHRLSDRCLRYSCVGLGFGSNILPVLSSSNEACLLLCQIKLAYRETNNTVPPQPFVQSYCTFVLQNLRWLSSCFWYNRTCCCWSLMWATGLQYKLAKKCKAIKRLVVIRH